MRVYIAGPIAGYPDGNQAAFAYAAEWLREDGHEPVNPHDVEPHRHDGRDCPPGPSGGQDAAHTAPCYMRTDLVAMLSCDAIHLLPGWEESGGARIEYLVAVHVCGIPVVDPGVLYRWPARGEVGAWWSHPSPPRSVRDAFALDAIDVAHLDHQRQWSAAAFGPSDRTEGVLDHMAKEAIEVRDAVRDGEDPLPEWVDLVILALDGAWRTGASSQRIIAAIKAKQARNEARTWPDWRTSEPGKAIEHDRTGEAVR